MNIQDEAFLPSKDGFHTTFFFIMVKVKTSGLPHVLNCVVGGKQGVCWIFPLLQILFLCQFNLFRIIRLSQRLGKSGQAQLLRI